MADMVMHDHAPGRPLPWRLLLSLAALALLSLWAASVIQDVLLHRRGAGTEGKIWLLDADSEQGILTWASVLILFLVARLLLAHGQHALASGRRPAATWFGLSALFLLLSLDEFASLHEKASALLQGRGFGGSGIFYFAWAAPAGLLALLGLLALGPFLRSLGPRVLRLAVLSALLYLLGAVGTEMLGGFLAERGGIGSFAYRLGANAEEALELSGLLLFVYALLLHREALQGPSV